MKLIDPPDSMLILWRSKAFVNVNLLSSILTSKGDQVILYHNRNM